MKTLFVFLIVFALFYNNLIAQCTPNAGNDTTICGNTFVLNGTLSQPGSTALWTSDFPGTVFSDSTQPVTSVIIPSSYVILHFILTETNTSIPCTSSDTVVVNFSPIPTSTFNAASPTCINTPTPVTYTGNGDVNAIYNWNFDGATILSGTTSGPYFVSWNIAGNYNISLQVTSLNGCVSTINTQTIQVVPFKSNCCITPIPNAGPDDIVCGQIYNLQGSVPILGNTDVWSFVSGPGSVTFTNPNLYNSIVGVSIIGTYTFKLTESSGSCDSSDYVIITFLHTPHTEAGVSQAVCGTITQLYADTIGSGIINGWWTSSVPGININYIGSDPIPWNPTVDASYLGSGFWINSQHEVWFYWHGQGGNGCSSIDSLSITFYEIPIANAGLDTSICGKSYDLTGNWSIINHSGVWSPNTGNVGTANFVPYTDPVSLVTVTQFGIYKFIWKEINYGNTTCFDRDTITINFKVVPMPDAGLDFSVCGKFAHICATPSFPGGQWSCPQGGVAYYDAPVDSFPHYNPSYKDSACAWIRWGSENGTVTMYWSEFNGVCYGHDTVNVYFGYASPAIALVNPADSVVCGQVYTFLNAQQPAYGYGFWIDTIHNTMFTPYSNTPNPTATIDNLIDNYGYHNFYWITVNGQCRDTSNVVRVNFKTNVFTGIAQSSLVTDFSNFKAEIFPAVSYYNSPTNYDNLSSNGNFSFWAEPNQNYYLKISAINPQLNTTLANTYYNSSYNWQDATILTTSGNCDTINVNVPLATYTPATGGQCRIYGLVRYDGSLNPVRNATVYLRYLSNQDLARFEFTNQSGYYSINNIANGNYKLFVDIPGLPQITNHHIIVNPNDTVFANVNFIVDTTSISKQYGFGIYADTTGWINVPLNNTDIVQVSVFPNPFNKQLNVSCKLSQSENISAEIFDNMGKLIISYPEKQYVNSDFKLTFQTSKLNNGIYFLKVSIGNSVYIKKITKQ